MTISRDDVIALCASHGLEAMSLEILVRLEIEEIDLFLEAVDDAA